MKKTLKGIVCLLIFAVGFYFGVRVGEHMTKQKMAEILNVTKVENSTKENKVGVSDLTDAKDDKKEAKAEVDDNTIYDKVSKWVHKNQFTGCRDFTLVTSQDNKQRLIDLLKDGWYQILHCPIQIITEDELNKDLNYTFIELNQYIDNNSPTDKLNLDNIKNI